MCPRRRFLQDLLVLLKGWREQGDRIIVCMDANEHIYQKSIGKALMDEHGLNMREVVGEFTGQKIAPTYFQGSKPIDTIWATTGVEVLGACLMPAGFGVGDHRLFQVDFSAASLLGVAPPKIIHTALKQLNTKIPRIADAYNKILEKSFVGH